MIKTKLLHVTELGIEKKHLFYKTIKKKITTQIKL